MTTTLISTTAEREQYARIRNMCMVIVSLLLVLLRRRMGQSVIGQMFGETAEEAVFVVFIVAIAIGMVFHFMSRSKKDIGKITLTEGNISLQLKSGDLSFDTNAITQLKVRRSFADISEPSLTTITSYDNWISFDHNNTSYQYQFTIGSSFADVEFKKLIEYWKENITGFSVEVLGQ